jgi:hypothetical protein
MLAAAVARPQGSAQTQHAVRKRREPARNNGHIVWPSGPPPIGPRTGSHGRGATHEIVAYQRKRQPFGYFSSCQAMTQ